MKTPSEIIGTDAHKQLVVEGYTVICSANLTRMQADLEDALARAVLNLERAIEAEAALAEEGR